LIIIKTSRIYKRFYKKIVRDRTLRIRIFDTKGLFRNLENKKSYIRGVGWRIVLSLKVCMIKTRPTTPRIGTAIGVGAPRIRAAIAHDLKDFFGKRKIFVIRVLFCHTRIIFVIDRKSAYFFIVRA